MTTRSLDAAACHALDAMLDAAVGQVPVPPAGSGAIEAGANQEGCESGHVPGIVAMVTDRDGDIYAHASGVRRIGDATPMTTDTVFALFSTTKALTATAALCLVDDGALDLDEPVHRHVAELGALQVLDGVDADGNETSRPPCTPITMRHLLTHTSGLGYDLFNTTYRRRVTEGRQRSLAPNGRDGLSAPLLFDPGQRWEYGIGIDWAGQVIEAVTGQRLGDVFHKRLFEPLGMTQTAFAMGDDMFGRMASLHLRQPDGSLKPARSRRDDPAVDLGGQGLYGTVGDYMRFIRMWLNDGAGEHGRVLKPETVRMAVRRHLAPDLQVTPMTGVAPGLTSDFEFFPGVRKSWSLPFMINEQDAPTGRPAGSLGWAGLANLFYWIDRANGIGGFWATQVLPFGDRAAVDAAMAFETGVYAALR